MTIISIQFIFIVFSIENRQKRDNRRKFTQENSEIYFYIYFELKNENILLNIIKMINCCFCCKRFDIDIQ